jgi:hypothetical protein
LVLASVPRRRRPVAVNADEQLKAAEAVAA